MYKGLYDSRTGLTPKGADLIGTATAQLISQWDRWVHRRVERVTFSDEDALNRDVSVDFSLPPWYHALHNAVSKSPALQLVPLGFLSKGPLVNFSLRDEHGKSLPLLIRPQNAQVAEAVLTVLAKEALAGKVPDRIRCDIRDLVLDPRDIARNTYMRLFEAKDPVWKQRNKLWGFSPFVLTADLFSRHFLALSMLEVKPHERRVVHFSYEEELSYDESLTSRGQLVRIGKQMRGQARRLPVMVTSVSEAASYHIEIEAPKGLMISKRVGDFFSSQGFAVKTETREGMFRRAHFHFSHVHPRRAALATVYLRPRRASVVRAATLMALLAFIATAGVASRYGHITQHKTEAAAALLLAAAGIIGIMVVRSGEDEMATMLLFPLRILASTPVVLAVLAAIVVVTEPAPWLGSTVLGVISVVMLVSVCLLIHNWRIIRNASRK